MDHRVVHLNLAWLLCRTVLAHRAVNAQAEGIRIVQCLPAQNVNAIAADQVNLDLFSSVWLLFRRVKCRNSLAIAARIAMGAVKRVLLATKSPAASVKFKFEPGL